MPVYKAFEVGLGELLSQELGGDLGSTCPSGITYSTFD